MKMYSGMFFNSFQANVSAARAYRTFCDGLIAQMRSRGHTVIDYCSRPNDTVITARETIPIPFLQPDEADILLVPNVRIGYAFASHVTADGYFFVLDARTNQLLSMSELMSAPPLNPPSAPFESYQDVAADLPRAFRDLNRAAAALGARMSAYIR